MKYLLFCFMFIFIFILTQGAAAITTETFARLKPIDESKEDKSFAKFKKQLIRATHKKNLNFIKNSLSENVEYSFGADPERKSPIDGFLKHYKIESKSDSEFWKNLREVLELGCTISGEEFVCPYVYSKWPDNYDSFEFVVATKEKTPIRKTPNSSAEVIKLSNFEILKLAKEEKSKGWRTIDLGNNQLGFAATTDVKGPIDYRASFQKTASGWKLKYFVAGD